MTAGRPHPLIVQLAPIREAAGLSVWEAALQAALGT